MIWVHLHLMGLSKNKLPQNLLIRVHFLSQSIPYRNWYWFSEREREACCIFGHLSSLGPHCIPMILWMVAISCTTNRMVETLFNGEKSPFNWCRILQPSTVSPISHVALPAEASAGRRGLCPSQRMPLSEGLLLRASRGRRGGADEMWTCHL